MWRIIAKESNATARRRADGGSHWCQRLSASSQCLRRCHPLDAIRPNQRPCVMANLPPDSPVFLTRGDVATLLRIGPRQVDRLATAGELNKVKLATRRTGFHRDGVEAYLAAKVNGANPSPNPSSPAPEYGTSASILIVKVEGSADGVAAAVERVLVDNGLIGCILHGRGDTISIAWADSLPYCENDMRRALRMATSAVRV